MVTKTEVKCEPTKVIYNGPATIVFFKDGDKVVVKKQDGDMMDREKAVAMAVMKKTLGTNEKKTNYLDKVKKLMKEAEKEDRKNQCKKSKELIDKARAELSGRMEFTKFHAAGWLAWYETCKKKHVGPGCEKAIATEMGYETITKFRKAKKEAQVKAKEE